LLGGGLAVLPQAQAAPAAGSGVQQWPSITAPTVKDRSTTWTSSLPTDPPRKLSIPTAGSAVATLVQGQWSQAGSYPVFVAPLSADDAGSSVKITVLDRSKASVPQDSPLSFTIAAADGARLSVPVAVKLDTRALSANQADQLDRLTLWTSASCVSTAVPCPAGAQLSLAGNDRAGQRLEFVSAPADFWCPPRPGVPAGSLAGCLGSSDPAAARSVPAIEHAVSAPLSSGSWTAANSAPPSAVPADSATPTPAPTSSVGSSTAAPMAVTAEATPSPADLTSASPAASPTPATAPASSTTSSTTADTGEASGLVYSLGSTGTVSAMSVGDSGAGDYTSTSWSPSNDWTAGTSSGAFTYDYTVPVPPAVAGAAPDVRLSYSSQAVDAMTIRSNNQASWVGLGWDYQPGYIERLYVPCNTDGENSAWYDKCWKAPSGAAAVKGAYELNFAGHTGALVETATANVYRLEDNPGWLIQHRTGAPSAGNADNDGEYWMIITNEGVRYTFGNGTEPTSNALTRSAWTIPVMGNNSGEPCYNAVKSLAICRQAYRWNLDRVEDTNQNVSSYFYTTETNKFAQMNSATTVTSYDRAGYLDHIDYGKRTGAESSIAPSRVLFSSVYRCTGGVSSSDPLNVANGSCAAPTATSTDYPDAPVDQICSSSTNCSGHYAPTFFQTKRLDTITTQVASGASFTDVAKIALKQSFPSNTDGTSANLWMNFLQRRGLYGGTVTEPVVYFAGQLMNNRVDYNTGLGVVPMKKYRVNQVRNELGGQLLVEYGEPDACPQNGTSDSGWSGWYAQVDGHWDTNTSDCAPTWFDPDGTGGSAPGFGIFHKYLATAVTAHDDSAGSPDMRTEYGYGGGAGWRQESLQFANLPNMTWDDYRGYSTVTIDTGVVGAAHASRNVNTYFRGMDGDKYANGTSKSVSLTDYDGNSYPDAIYLTGYELQTRTFNASGYEVTSAWHQYWVGMGVSGPGVHDSHAIRTAVTRSRDALSAGGWRTHPISYTYDIALGVPIQVNDVGDLADPNDNRCATTDYNTTRTTVSATGTYWMINYPINEVLRSGACDTGTLLRHQGSLYDNSTTLGDVLYRGNLTGVLSYKDASSYIRTQAAFDLLGRPTSSTTGRGLVTSVSYSPATGWPASGITTSRVHQNSTNYGGGTGSLTLTSTIVPSPAFGSPTSVTDENGQSTLEHYDALGRLTSVGRPLDRTGTDSKVFSYVPATVSGPVAWAAPARVQSLTNYNNTPDWITSYTYTDGWGRPRQTQTVSPYTAGGTTFRIVSETQYDERGLVKDVSGPLSNALQAGSGMLTLSEASMLTYTKTAYDALARPVSQTLYGRQTGSDPTTAQAETDFYYYGDATLVTPPVGPQTKTSYNVFGQTTAVRTYASSSSIQADYTLNNAGDVTAITQTPSSTMTPATLSWTNGYDLLGRRTSASDPDVGTSTTTFDADGNTTDVTAGGITLHTSYDDLNRPTSLTSAAGAKVWTSTSYDTATLGKGKLAATTSYSGAAPPSPTPTVTHAVSSYDARGRLTGESWSFPDPRNTTSTVTVPYSYTYDYADRPLTQTYGAPTGITGNGVFPAETITQAYQGGANNGAPGDTTTSALSTSRPLASPQYNTIGMTALLGVGEIAGTTGATAGATQRYYYYDLIRYAPTRLATSTSAGSVSDTLLDYDANGTPTRISDTTNSQYECFTYEGYYRLKHAWTQTGSDCSAGDAGNTGTGSFQPYSRRYVYDLYNRRSSVNIDGSLLSSNYTDAAHPNGVTNTSGIASLAGTYTYGSLGRQATRTVGVGALQSQSWNDLGQLSSSTNPAESYTYGPDSSRVTRTTATDTTVYLPGTEITFDTGPSGTISSTRYYTAAGKTVGTRSLDAAGASTLTWLQTSRNASTDLAIDDSTGNVSRRRHLPFGEVLGTGTGTGFTAHGFLNKPEDATGLDQLGARYYDPVTGTFTSPDPLLEAAPLVSNPYTYASANPVALEDPTGLRPDNPSVDTGDPSIPNDYVWASDTSVAPGESAPTPKVAKALREHMPEGYNPYNSSGDQLLDASRNYVGLYEACNLAGSECPSWLRMTYKAQADAAAFLNSPLGRWMARLSKQDAETAQHLLPMMALLPALFGNSRFTGAGAAEGGERLLWTSWQNYPKVMQGGREYAQIGDRLYTRHAVDRLQPSGLGAPAGAIGAGRSISPNFVEDVLSSSRGIPVKGPNGEARLSFTSGTVQVITENNIVITVITR